MAGSAAVSSPEVPPATRRPDPPRLSDEEVTLARFASAALEFVGGILAIYSVFTVWFYMAGGGVATQFFPGTSFKTNGTWSTYASSLLGPVGGLYLAVLVLGIVGGAALLAGGLLTLIEAARRRPATSRRNVGTAIAGAVVMAAAWVVAPALQPWALHDSSGFACSTWSGTSPCSLPWGPGKIGAVGYTFYMADGWIIMLGALTLATIGLVIGRLGKNAP